MEQSTKRLFYCLVCRVLDIWLGIWAVNILFHCNIDYSFKNIIAFWILVAIMDSGLKQRSLEYYPE